MTIIGPIKEVYLKPGEFHFAEGNTRIRTLLGSCVAITMWHPELRIGGMCHYLLPTRRKKGDVDQDLDGRYGDEAILLFTKEAQRRRTHPKQYEIKIFGGGDMFPRYAKGNITAIGTLNVSGALSRLRECGCVVKAQHVGGIGHRVVIMEVWSGEVWVKHHPNYVIDAGHSREMSQ